MAQNGIDPKIAALQKKIAESMSLLPESEKDAILAKVLFESQIREALKDEPKEGRKPLAWLGHPIVLLLLGSFGSIALLPAIQARIDHNEWRSKTVAENRKYLLEKTREATNAFTMLGAVGPEAETLNRRFSDGTLVGKEELTGYGKQLGDLERRMFLNLATVRSAQVYFATDRAKIDAEVGQYAKGIGAYVREVRNQFLVLSLANETKDPNLRAQFLKQAYNYGQEVDVAILNRDYAAALKSIIGQADKRADDYERLP